MSSRHKAQTLIVEIYERSGLEHTLSLCDDLMEDATVKNLKAGFEKVSMIRGKLCEVVLEIMLTDYIKKNNLTDWFFIPSLYLWDVATGNREYCTEVDMVLFTPSRAVLFECKSYAGDKVLVDKGTLKRAKNKITTDVYAQQEKHLEVFVSTFEAYKKRKDLKSGYRVAFFDYSTGTLKDVREDRWKVAFPVINKDNLYEYLDKLRTFKTIWDLDGMRQVVNILEKNKDNTSSRHLNYVRSLHPGKKDNSGGKFFSRKKSGK